jgi:hypothetical protein
MLGEKILELGVRRLAQPHVAIPPCRLANNLLIMGRDPIRVGDIRLTIDAGEDSKPAVVPRRF